MKGLPRLREAREDAALSQRDLAQKAGVSPDTIRTLEGGIREAQPGTIRKLATVLKVKPRDLWAGPDVQAASRVTRKGNEDG